MARHALLIGVSQFKDERLAALNAPTHDVEKLGDVLRDPKRGNFDSVIISPDKDIQTIRDQLAALFEDRDPGDLLLLYYSGHGIRGRGNRLFLATPDSDFDRPQARSLSSVELREQMDQTRAEQQIILLDCCYSGVFVEGAKGAANEPAVTHDTFNPDAKGRYVLTAASAVQFAWDGDALRSGNPAERSLSRFTSWLVDGVGHGFAAPGNKQITMDAVFQYVHQRAKEENSRATPQRYLDRGTGELVIARNPAVVGRRGVVKRSNSSKPPKPTNLASIPELHETKFWHDRSEVAEDGEKAVFLTVVLPTGRSVISRANYLALVSDAVAVPEVCLELSRLIEKTAQLRLEVNTVLDIDLLEEPRSTPSCLSCKNLLLLGTPDINAITAQMIEQIGGVAIPGETPGFAHPHSTEILDAAGVSHSGKDQPEYGLFGMYDNPFVVSKLDKPQSRRIAMICAGCGVHGTIAATKFLLRLLKNKKEAVHSEKSPNIPVRIVKGFEKDYKSNLKPRLRCRPRVEMGNVIRVEPRD